MSFIIPMKIQDLKPGMQFEFPAQTLSQGEIITFAEQFDPLDFHTDPEAAKKSIFKKLIASGPHIFNLSHRKYWIPMFGKTVHAGLEISNWKFLKPIYADMLIHGKVEILDIKPNFDRNSAVIKWKYEFKNEQNELLQTLEMTIFHKLN